MAFQFIRIAVIFILTARTLFTAWKNGLDDLDIPLKVVRLTDKVIVLSAMTGNSTAVAVSSKKGLVMIDTFWSPSIAKKARGIIEEKFGRKDFAYYINTNSNLLSSGGNEAFSEGIGLAHENAGRALEERRRRLARLLRDRALEFQGRVERAQASLEKAEPDSPKAENTILWRNLCARIAADFQEGYEIRLPSMTFRDALQLDLGDLTLELSYIGEAGGAGGILIKIPEERVVAVGDLFHYLHVLPFLEGEPRDLDVPRWIALLDEVMDPGAEVRHVVCSNAEKIWGREELLSRRRLINDIWTKTVAAHREGRPLDAVLARFASVEKEFPYVEKWSTYVKTGPGIIRDDISRLAKAIWKKLEKEMKK